MKLPDYVLTILESKNLQSNNNFENREVCCKICEIATAPGNKNLLTGNDMQKNTFKKKNKKEENTKSVKCLFRGEHY